VSTLLGRAASELDTQTMGDVLWAWSKMPESITLETQTVHAVCAQAGKVRNSNPLTDTPINPRCTPLHISKAPLKHP